MFAVNRFEYRGLHWFGPGADFQNAHGRRRGLKTTVEQALIRGLDTA